MEVKKDIENYLESVLNDMLLIVPEEKQKEAEANAAKIMRFRKELNAESDRGCALLATGRLDVLLESLLKKCLIGSKTHLKQVFGTNGPLQTFSSRIKLAYSLGLISKNAMAEIDTIRGIRNAFAHSDEPINFDHPEIAELCQKLNLIPQDGRTNRKHFITTFMFLLGYFESKILNQKKIEELQEPFEPKTMKQIGEVNKKFREDVLSDLKKIQGLGQKEN